MKSVISAGIIFILIIVMVLASTLYVNKVTDEMLQYLYRYENNFSYFTWEALEYETEKISVLWGNSRRIMSVLFNHHATDELDKSIKKLKDTVKIRETEDFLYEKSNLIRLLLSFREQQKLSIENIM